MLPAPPADIQKKEACGHQGACVVLLEKAGRQAAFSKDSYLVVSELRNAGFGTLFLELFVLGCSRKHWFP